MADFPIPVDDAHVKEYNEYFRQKKQLMISAVLLGIISAGAGAATLYFGGLSLWPIIIAAVLFLITVCCVVALISVPKQIGSAEDLYADWPLAATMIAHATDRSLVIIALVETAAEPNVDSRLALTIRPVTKLYGTKRAVGTRVPSVAVAGKHKASSIHWDEITPVPVCWANPDKKVVAEAGKEIPEGRWQELARHLSRWEDVGRTPNNLLPLDKLD